MTALSIGFTGGNDSATPGRALLRFVDRSGLAARGVETLPLFLDLVALLAVFSVMDLQLAPVAAALVVIACLGTAGLYRRRLTLGLLDVTPRVLAAAALGALAVVLMASEGYLGIDLLLSTAAAACGAAMVGRWVAYVLMRWARRYGIVRRRTAVLGAGPVGSTLVDSMLDECQWGLQPVALFERGPMAGEPVRERVPTYAFGENMAQIVKSEDIQTLLVAFPNVDDAELLRLVRDCGRLDCEILMVPRLWEECPVSSGMDRIGAVPLRRVRQCMRRNPMWQVKLLSERMAAGIALIAISPLLVALAVAVKVSGRSAPVLFRQDRVGLNGKEFGLLKFRSMSPANETESQTKWSIIGDQRITRVGKFMRATSLDELPQLWNIFRGDMALIGPRPERRHFVEQFSSGIPGYDARHRVPAGLTGWAAINGLSGDTSIADRARYDNFYVANWTLWFDFTIALRTASVLVTKFLRERTVERAVLANVVAQQADSFIVYDAQVVMPPTLRATS
jgi:exopolysaccharide biosynthesis polyprenyl glycosylphosphotransferase